MQVKFFCNKVYVRVGFWLHVHKLYCTFLWPRTALNDLFHSNSAFSGFSQLSSAQIPWWVLKTENVNWLFDWPMISKASCKEQRCLNYSLGWKASSMSVAYNNSPAYYVNCVTVLAACSSVARLNVRLILWEICTDKSLQSGLPYLVV